MHTLALLEMGNWTKQDVAMTMLDQKIVNANVSLYDRRMPCTKKKESGFCMVFSIAKDLGYFHMTLSKAAMWLWFFFVGGGARTKAMEYEIDVIRFFDLLQLII